MDLYTFELLLALGLGLLVTGVVAGVLAGLLGVGGGIVIVSSVVLVVRLSEYSI